MFNRSDSRFNFLLSSLILFSALLTSCADTHPRIQGLDVNLQVQELKSGMSESRTVYKKEMTDSPSGLQSFSDHFRVVKQTDSIPARLGQKFGVIFQMNSNVDDFLEVEQVWIFPSPIRFADGKEFKEVRYNIEKPTNEPTFSFYELENEYEVVKGEWIYQMFYKGKKIFEKKFYLE